MVIPSLAFIGDLLNKFPVGNIYFFLYILIFLDQLKIGFLYFLAIPLSVIFSKIQSVKIRYIYGFIVGVFFQVFVYQDSIPIYLVTYSFYYYFRNNPHSYTCHSYLCSCYGLWKKLCKTNNYRSCYLFNSLSHIQNANK